MKSCTVLCVAGVLVATAGCKPRVDASEEDLDSSAGNTNGTVSAAGPNETSTTGDENNCPESDLPEPFCYERIDIGEALGNERYAVAGTGRFGEDGTPGLLMVTADAMHFAFWDGPTERFEIVRAAEAPGDVGWGLGSAFNESGPPAIACVTSSTYDDVVIVSAGEVHHFPGQARGFGTPISTPAWYEDKTRGEIHVHKTLATIDVDGDERSEIVVAADRFVQIWRHQPSGWEPWGPLLPHGLHDFEEPWLTCGHPLTVRVADIDGDGHEDMVLLFTNDCPTVPLPEPGVVVLRNTDGTPEGFHPSHAPHGLDDQYVTFLEVADINRDGALDIIASPNGSSHGGPPNSVRAWMGRGDGTFERVTELLPDAWVHGAADLDGSGASALLVVPFEDGTPVGLQVMLAGPELRLVELASVQSPLIPVGDLNRDGAPELFSPTIAARDNRRVYLSIR